MDNAAQFTIELIDKVTGPSRKAASSIDRINKKLKDSKGRMSALTPKQFKKFAGGKALDALGAGVSGVGSMLTGGLAAGAKWATVGIAGLGAAMATFTTQGVVRMAMFADASRRAFASLTGSTEKGAEAFEMAKKTANDLGLDVAQVADQFKGLLAMQFKADEADEMIRISADLQAITGHAESAARAITAITQIKAKGKLQSEELVGQLAEAGVSTTLVYDQLAKSLGKSQAEVRAMLAKGAITADVGIAAIKEAIKTKLHEEKAGEAATAFAKSTLTGLMNTIGTLPNKLFLKVAEIMETDFEGVKDTLRDIIAYVDTIDARAIAGFVKEVLEMLKLIVPLAKEFMSGFMAGFSEMVSGMTGLAAGSGLADQMERARAAGRGLAEIFGFLITLGRILASIVGALSTGWGKALFILTGIVYVFTKFILLLGTITQLVIGTTAGVGTLAAGWSTFTAGLGIAWGWIVALGGIIKTVTLAVGGFIAGILSIPVVIGAAAVAVIAAIVIWREEIAKFMLWLWDAGFEMGANIIAAVSDGITNAWPRFLAWLARLASQVLSLFGIEVGAPAAAAPTAPRPPEFTDAVKQNGQKGGRNINSTLTVNVEGTAAAKDPKLAGKQVGEAAADTLNEHLANANP